MARSKEYSHPPEEGSKSKTPIIWKILTLILLLVCIALLIALIVVASRSPRENKNGKVNGDRNDNIDAKPCPNEPAAGIKISRKSSSIYEDLSAEEITAVRDYMYADNALNITPYDKATVADNYIYFIKLRPPSKADALNHLDKNGPKPRREAIVSVYAGGRTVPRVEEYIVYPAAKPTQHTELKVPGQRYPIPFDSRPFDETIEAREITRMLKEATSKVNQLILESYDGFSFGGNCSNKCITYMYASPMGFYSDTRKTWFWMMRDVPGKYENPLNFEVYIDHKGSDVSKWKILKIVYNNQSFISADELLKAYNAKTLKISKMPAPSDDKLFSSYERRGDPQPAKPSRGPELFEPDGKRYAVDKERVEYMGWEFEFRVDSINGMEIYDIRFKGERIVYELAIQEAIATYTGYYPSQTHMYYLDGNWRLGMSSFELVPGIDCPKTASFFNLTHMIGTPNTVTMKNAVCVFEQNTGIPLRRHEESDFVSSYKFYGGMANNVLILRTVPTVYNYDYIWDFIFYQNGIIEVRLSASGYVMGSIYTDDAKAYCNKLSNHGGGCTHDHLVNFKVDMDILGTENSYETIEIGIENVTSRWLDNFQRVRKVLIPQTKQTEQEALYKYNFDRPKYLNFYNEEKKNKMGVRRGYRIQNGGLQKLLYPEDWFLVPMISWGLYQMAVTRHKDSERYSSSPYNQNAGADPQVDFRDFVKDNESIVNQDLVAWVTIGMMHVPHSEDIPNTATAANQARFFIRPFNYFDEDPSIGSTNAIMMTPVSRGTNHIERYGTSTGPVCTPMNKTLDFSGIY